MKSKFFAIALFIFSWMFSGTVSARTVPDPMDVKIQHARSMVKEYSTKYDLKNLLDFEFIYFSKNTNFSGNAEMQWGPDRCIIRIDPMKAEEFWGDKYFKHSLAFVSLHEFAHCVYYKDLHLDWKKAGYRGSVEPRALDEYLVSDAVVELQDRAGFLAIAHEAYADAFAIQAFRKLGFSWKSLEHIRTLREKSAFDKVHATGEVFNLLRKGNYDHLDPVSAAKIVAAKFMMQEHNFKFVLGSMTGENSASFIVNNWCSFAVTEEEYPVEHPMLGKVVATDYFYPSLKMPQFIKTQFEKNPVHWKDTCKNDASALLRSSKEFDF